MRSSWPTSFEVTSPISLRNITGLPRKAVMASRREGRIAPERTAEQVKMAAPVVPSARSAASRWIFASNVVGGLVTVALVIYFGIQSFLASTASQPR